MAERGVIYVATGERYLAEAAVSASSLKRHMPNLPTLLFTEDKNVSLAGIDEVRAISNPRRFFIDKVYPLLETPFERTLFLDTDTYVCADISDLFDILGRFDLAVAHAPLRHDRPYPTPNCFAEMNSGVIAYRLNDRVRAMFQKWLEIYEEELRVNAVRPEIGDQVHLRRAIYESEVSPYILPPEYNFRSVSLAFAARQKVRIIHGRSDDLAVLERNLNASTSMRAVFPTLGHFNPRQAIFLDGPGRIFASLAGRIISLAARLKKTMSGE